MEKTKLTKQGVRDLGSVRRRPVINPPKQCQHKRMRYCCHPKNCGHLACPDCGLYWDDGAQL